MAGTYTITLTISDPFTGSITDPFDLRINSRPTFHSTNGRIPSEIKIPQGISNLKASDYFQDNDVAGASNDALTYSIKEASGLSVGSWVSLNPTTGFLIFTAGLSNVGWNYFQVTATDKAGASFTQPFGLLVNSKP